MRRVVLAPLACAALLLSACSTDPQPGTGPTPTDGPGSPSSAPTASSPAASSTAPSASPDDAGSPTAEETPEGFPELQVETVTDQLTLPWDVAELAGGELLVTEKDSGRVLLLADGEQRELTAGPEGLWSSGETGMMSIVVDPTDENRFLTCQGWTDGTATDVRVVDWTLDAERTTATEGEVLVQGIQSTSGRHGGCRMLMGTDGELWIGTGDAAVGTNPQDRTSLNGKVLRVDAQTGDPMPDNPFVDSEDENEQLVYSYGHRNVQGLALRDGELYSAEHGPDVDDEVNLIQAGANYGWNPVPAGGGEGYDESVPMTDTSLDGDVVAAVWSSGDPTLATSGLTAVDGAEWGGYAGSLAVANLKAQRMLFLPLDADGAVGEPQTPDVLTQHGRLRSVIQAGDGSLLVTTSNGSSDELLRVTPVG